MERTLERLEKTPDRLSPIRARLLAGVALFNLVLGLVGLIGRFDDDPARPWQSAFLALIGVANLAWVFGSLFPEGRAAKFARVAVVPLGLLVLLASLVVLAAFALHLAGRA